MAKDPAFLFYSQDFIVGVQTMTFDERGKYITILAQMHQQGRLSEETICFLVGSISVSLRLKFKQDEKGLWYNERLEAETVKRNQFTESRRNNGKNGGRPKKSKASGKPNLNHKQNHMVNHMGNEDEDVNESINDIIVLPFKSEIFLKVWNTWLQFRTEIGKPYKSKISHQSALKKLSLYSEDVAIKMIEQSISNSWQGIFELKENNNGKFNKNGHHLTEEGTRKRLDSYTND
jgi:hypothetical protein